MTISRRNPNTVFLGGPRTEINDLTAKAAITPGHLVDRVNTAGVWQWQKHATAGGANGKTVATEPNMQNVGIDTAYAALDLVEVSALAAGATAYMFIASGQNISYGAKMESAGDGTLRVLASGVALFVALESPGAVTAQTRLRVEAL